MTYNHGLYQEDLGILTDSLVNWESINGKNILITGASGMIGTFLIDLFMRRNEKYESSIKICALSRNMDNLKRKFKCYEGKSGLKFIEQDVSKEFCLENECYDYIIHATSNTHPKEYSSDPIGTITTNVFGTYYLLE